MWLKSINLFTIFQIYNLIGQSFSAIFLSFGKDSLGLAEDYIRLRHSSVHRGVFLSLSDDRIHEMCKDFYSSQLYGNSAEKMSATPKYSLLVQEMAVNGDRTFDEWGLVVVCFTGKFKNRIPSSKHYYLTSAFRSKWLYQTEIPNTDPTRHDQFLTNFVALSPDYVDMEKADLETWYLNTLQTIIALKNESPEYYFEQILKEDYLSGLSKKQKLILCASILSSPAYRQDNLEYSLRWIIDAFYAQGTVNYEELEVSFRDVGSKVVKLKTKCFLCKAFEDGTDMKSAWTNLYIAQTYENRNSVMVLKQQKDGIIYPDKYFKNIAILSIAQEEMNYNNLLLNFQKPERSNL